MANINAVLLATLESIPFYNINNDAVREEMHQAKAALQVYFMYGNEPMKKRFFLHLNAAQALIKASLPIDYTPKKSVIDDWDAEPTFGQHPPKQETDLEDLPVVEDKLYVCYEYTLHARHLGIVNSKSKSKWSRSGKAARVLSNR
jgi:hypothetical protein